MPYPRLDDDGTTVTLDLHGVTVADALALAEATVQEAARHGRASVKLIHGASTSSQLYRNRSIKHTLYALLDRGRLDRYVTDAWRAEGHLLLSLGVTAATDVSRITLEDVRS